MIRFDNDSVIFAIDWGTSASVRLQRIDGQDVATLSTYVLTPGVLTSGHEYPSPAIRRFAASNSPNVGAKKR